MSRVSATAADAGRSCPYCRFPLKQGVAAERCDACNSLHHEDCWRDGGGCAVLGCTQAAAANPAQVPTGAYSSPTLALPAGSYPPTFAPPPRSNNPTIVLVAVLIALLGVGAGVVVSTGALSSGTHTKDPSAPSNRPSPSMTSSPATTSAGPTPAERAHAQQAIIVALDTYQQAYSDHSLSGLADIFTPTVKRHGLAAGGCTISYGRNAVLGDYQSQFNEGSGTYELVGLVPGEIQMDGKTRAHLDAHYQITPGTSGYVNFRFAELGEGWKVSEVDATCT